MKKFQSYNQFEAEWKKEGIPEIDLDKVKSKVINSNRIDLQPYRGRQRMVLVAVVVIFTLCFTTIAIAIYNGWQLKNNKGDVVLSYSESEKSEVANFERGAKEGAKFAKEQQELRESLAPGEVAYFLVTKEYGISKFFRVLQKEVRISDIEKLMESTTTKFKIPQYLTDTYKFEYGTILYKTENEDSQIAEALYKEAQENHKAYIVKREKLTKEAAAIVLKYVNDEGYKLTIQIRQVDNLKSLGNEKEPIEKLSVSDKEVLYIKSNLDGADTDEYIFVDEAASGSLTYFITNYGFDEVHISGSDKTSLPLPKEEAAKMIESFK